MNCVQKVGTSCTDKKMQLLWKFDSDTNVPNEWKDWS